MNIDTRITKAALRSVWEACKENKPADQLRAALEGKSAQAFGAVQGGVITVTQANGHRTEFDPSVFSQDQVVAQWEYLIELYDRAVAVLGFDQTDNPTGQAIFNQILTYLDPILGTQANFVYMTK